jgi:hypothetical protein
MRTVEDTLESLKGFAHQAWPGYTFYIEETELPGGSLPDTFPLGTIKNFRYTQALLETGVVGSPPGRPNLYWIRLFDSQFGTPEERIAASQAQLAGFNEFKAILTPEDGTPCFDGARWVVVWREHPDYLLYAQVQYRGTHVVVEIDEWATDPL